MNRQSTNAQPAEEIRQLLARAPFIRSACDLDLLVFLHRHPRALLTSEQVAAFVGYDMKQVAQAIDAFIDAGLLERTQNPMHAARMYLLVLNGSHGGGLKAMLEMASSRNGRQQILQFLVPARRSESPLDIKHEKRRLHAVS